MEKPKLNSTLKGGCKETEDRKTKFWGNIEGDPNNIEYKNKDDFQLRK